MGELILRIRKFSFKGILIILLVFSLIAAVLLVELSGIHANRFDRSLELLADHEIFTKTDAHISLAENALLTGSWWIILIPGAFLVTLLMCLINIGNYLRKTANRKESNL